MTARKIYALTKAEYAKAKARYGSEATFARDRDGFFAFTHRARSKSYAEPDGIPIKTVRWIVSTG